MAPPEQDQMPEGLSAPAIAEEEVQSDDPKTEKQDVEDDFDTWKYWKKVCSGVAAETWTILRGQGLRYAVSLLLRSQ